MTCPNLTVYGPEGEVALMAQPCTLPERHRKYCRYAWDPNITTTRPANLEHHLEGLQSELANLISDLSEEGYAAGWMHDVEWAAWELVSERRRTGTITQAYGNTTLAITAEFAAKLDVTASVVGGWVWWLDEAGETFVPSREWRRLVELRRERPDASNDLLAVLAQQR